MTDPGVADIGDALLELALSDPERAAVELARLAGQNDVDPALLVTALQARGLVARQRGRHGEAREYFNEAIGLARDARLPQIEGQVRVSLAASYALGGEVKRALAECDRAEALVRGRWKARLDSQRAALLRVAGRSDEALEMMTRALVALRRHGDARWEARLLHNRGSTHLERYEFTQARADLARSESIASALGMDRLLAQSRHHLGIVAAATGDLPAAIRWFDSADDVLTKLRIVDPHTLFDRAQAFSNAGLGVEAMDSAAAAVRRLEAEGDALYLAEAQLVFAESALMLGRDREASEAAETARRAFVRHRRHGYAAMARFALLRARARGGADPQLLQEARRVAATLHSFRFVDPALDASLLAGQMALQLGRKRVARHELESVSVHRQRGTPLQRVKGWHAEALLRVAASRPASARSAARAGLAVLDEHRASLNATDLRVHAARHATDLAALGLRLAAARPSARALFDWMELTRAGAMRFTPAQPADDALLAGELAALRTVERNLRRAELEGRDTGPARREQARLQAAVRRRTRQAPGAETHRTAPLRASDALAVLDGWSLVELATIDGLLHAVVLADGRARHSVLAPVTHVARELDALRAATRRMANPQISEGSRAAAWLMASNARRVLDEVLLAPLSLGDHSLVLVPPPVLQAVPWGSLSRLRGRPTVVSPSARTWYERRSYRPTTERVVLASGPGLPQGGYETLALERIWPSALRIGSKTATTKAVATAMQGASLAHLVCHGKFRADNPLFSSLEMADGALYVYDLERLRRPPETMVLSACDVGVPAERPGDEVLGVVATLLAGGTSTVIASVGLVPDAVVTRRLMVAMHRRIASGARPAVALADALSGLDPDDPAALLASSFVCFGAG